MKNSMFISIFILLAFGVFSCTTNKTAASEYETTVAQEIPATVEVVQESTVGTSLPVVNQAWEDGTIEITGKI